MKKIFLVLGGLFLVLGSLSAQARFSIRFYDKEIYYPDRPIRILASVKNTGTTPYWFSMPDNPVFHLKFRVMALGSEGLYLPNSDEFNENRYNNQPVFFRDVGLKPGEEFSFTVDLKDFTALTAAGAYSIEAEFFPSLIPEFRGLVSRTHEQQGHQASWQQVGAMDDSWRSNILTLSVRPALPGSEAPVLGHALPHGIEAAEILRREALSPDEVVRKTIEARQDSQPEKFYLYLNLEELYKRSPQYRRTYQVSALEDRERILEEYKRQLWRSEQAISKVPASFEILSTSYQSREGLVKARLRFDGGDFYEIREYTYALRKAQGFWEIYDYQVRNLTNEAKTARSMAGQQLGTGPQAPAMPGHEAPATQEGNHDSDAH